MSPSILETHLSRIRRRRAALIAVVAGLPLALLAFYVGPGTRESREILLLGWVVAWSVTTLSVAFSRCPACEQLFHSVRGLDNPLARSCRGCGLPLASAHRAPPT